MNILINNKEIMKINYSILKLTLTGSNEDDKALFTSNVFKWLNLTKLQLVNHKTHVNEITAG